MAIPWRAAEAMHWQLGEHEMARRVGAVPFSLSSSTSRTRRASTSLSRQRTGPASRLIYPPPQLPSIQELTAGVRGPDIPVPALPYLPPSRPLPGD